MSTFDHVLEAIGPALLGYVPARRWFRGKTRRVVACTMTEAIPLPVAGEEVWLAVVKVDYAEGGSDDYALPWMKVDRERAEHARKSQPHRFICDLPELGEGGAVLDALGDSRVLHALLALVDQEATLTHEGSALRFTKIAETLDPVGAAPRPVEGEQSNTSIVFGQSYILKVVRKVDRGASADVEMGTFLTHAKYTHAPAVEGIVDLVRQGGEPATIGILSRYVPNQGDGWAFFLDRLTRRWEKPVSASDPLGDDRALVRRLATRVAEMHLALASRPDLPAFAPEPISRTERAELAGAVRASLRSAVESLRARASSAASDVIAHEGALEAILDRFVARDLPLQKTRVHGDLHLGQVLLSGDDFVLIDFEGEPARPLEARKAKRSPLVDVAGVLRSLHYASVSASRAASGSASVAEAWRAAAEEAFLDAYFAFVRGASFLPAEGVRDVLDFYLLEKCVYEVLYEMNNRPDWITIPLAGLAHLIEARHGG